MEDAKIIYEMVKNPKSVYEAAKSIGQDFADSDPIGDIKKIGDALYRDGEQTVETVKNIATEVYEETENTVKDISETVSNTAKESVQTVIDFLGF